MRIPVFPSAAGLVASVALLAPAAHAGHDPCHTTLGLRVDVPGIATFYVDDRSTYPPVPGILVGSGTWVYLETNGVPGLQRGGVGLLGERLGAEPEPCVESPTPDTFLF